MAVRAGIFYDARGSDRGGIGRMDLLLFNFHDVILIMTTYQCALFALLLLVVRRENRLSHVLLAGFLLTQAAIPMDILISFGAGFREWAIGVSPNLFYTFGTAYWLEGPLLLWYTRSLIYKDYRLGRRDLAYLVPFAAYVLYEFLVYFRMDSAAKSALLMEYDLFSESVLTHGIGLTRETLRVAFGVMCLVEIGRCRREIRQTHSNIDNIDFAWLKMLVIGFLAIRGWAVLVSVAIISSVHLDLLVDYRIMGLTSNYAVFLLISTMIFLTLSHSSMFEGIDLGAEERGARETGAARAAVDPELAARVRRHMETGKPHLASVLTLEQLAHQLDMPQRTLSNVINRHFGCNFFEFVNGYRIEEAKRLLADPAYRNRTVMEVMMDSGFNSKATFNTFFKKLMGMTPTQYRRGLENSMRIA